jgi:lipopolysaccharide cholinephosphotransferase
VKKIDNRIEFIQKGALVTFKEFHELCTKENIKYFIFYGTLLGSERHKGFIPWDDDIDVCMFRNDYNRLMMILSDNQISCVTYRNCKSPWGFTKVYTGRTLVEEIGKFTHPELGIGVDIFVMDSFKKNGVFLKVLHLLKEALMIFSIDTSKKRKGWRMMPNKILKLVPFKVNRVLINLVNYFGSKSSSKNINTSNVYSNIQWVSGIERNIFNKNEIMPLKKILFEGISVSTVSNPKLVLAKLYGEEYYKIPPEDKRSTGHLVKIINYK